MCRPALHTVLAVAVGLLAPRAHAQLVQATGLSPFVKDYKIDFAVPDAPAFKLLQVDQSAILRPQTVRDLTLGFDDFRGSNGQFVVPKQLGVEFSPALLAGGSRLTVEHYNAAKYLYATRLSGATSRDSLGRGQLAAGLRFSLVDEQDLRSKGAGGADTAVTRLTAAILAVYSAARDRVGPLAPLVLTAAEQQAVATLTDSIKSYWADHYWNANSLEVAFAGRASTVDTLGHDPKVDQLAAWATYANGVGGWGQFLLGVTLGSARDASGTFKPSNAVASRLYVGSNALKAFVEAQRAVSSATLARWLVNSGVEIKLPSVLWLDASAGVESAPAGGRPRAVSSFTIKSGVPGMR